MFPFRSIYPLSLINSHFDVGAVGAGSKSLRSATRIDFSRYGVYEQCTRINVVEKARGGGSRKGTEECGWKEKLETRKERKKWSEEERCPIFFWRNARKLTFSSNLFSFASREFLYLIEE